MGIIVKKGIDMVPVAEGSHHAICYALYDIGTQFSEKFGKSAHQAIVIWELPDERIDIQKDDKMVSLPRAISKKFTLSLHEKSNLRKSLESWRGRSFTETELEGFDITKLLGVNCLIQVIHTKKDNKTYANIASIAPLYKGITPKKPENKERFFSMSDSMEIPENTPDWIKELIEGSAEYQGRFPAEEGREEPPVDLDQVPF